MVIRLRRKQKVQPMATSEDMRLVIREELASMSTEKKRKDAEERHKELVSHRIKSLSPRAKRRLLRYLKAKREAQDGKE